MVVFSVVPSGVDGFWVGVESDCFFGEELFEWNFAGAWDGVWVYFRFWRFGKSTVAQASTL